MPYRYRVEKRRCNSNAATKRGRGRPKAWSSSWQMQLVVLRLCGLSVGTIMELLNLMNGGNFNAKYAHFHR